VRTSCRSSIRLDRGFEGAKDCEFPYPLWEIGYLTLKDNAGQSLGLNPWWVVVTAVTYAESAWFKVPPPFAIIIGVVLGLCWYGAVGR
jgi:hypothetical protein